MATRFTACNDEEVHVGVNYPSRSAVAIADR